MRDGQRVRILRHLGKGKSLTPLQAFQQFGTLRLAARIAELKAEGWPVVAEIVTTRDGARVARYSIPRFQKETAPRGAA